MWWVWPWVGRSKVLERHKLATCSCASCSFWPQEGTRGLDWRPWAADHRKAAGKATSPQGPLVPTGGLQDSVLKRTPSPEVLWPPRLKVGRPWRGGWRGSEGRSATLDLPSLLGLMGKAHFCALVSPIYRTWGSPPRSLGRQFPGTEKSEEGHPGRPGAGFREIEFEIGRWGERGQWPAVAFSLGGWGQASVTLRFRSRCGRLVASDGRPAATWGRAG